MWDVLWPVLGTGGMLGAIYVVDRRWRERRTQAAARDDFEVAAEEAIAITRIPRPRGASGQPAGTREPRRG